MRCPSCRAENPPDVSICSECGDALPAADGRKKLAASYPIAQAQENENDVVDVIPAGKRHHSDAADADEDGDFGDGGIGTLIPYRNPKALAAYYFGFFSLIPVVGLLAAPFAIVLGVMGFRTARANPNAKGSVHAWIGIIFGFLSLLCNSAGTVVFLLAPIR